MEGTLRFPQPAPHKLSLESTENRLPGVDLRGQKDLTLKDFSLAVFA